MIYGLETPLTLLIALIGSFIVIYAQTTINSAYKTYQRKKNNSQLIRK